MVRTLLRAPSKDGVVDIYVHDIRNEFVVSVANKSSQILGDAKLASATTENVIDTIYKTLGITSNPIKYDTEPSVRQFMEPISKSPLMVNGSRVLYTFSAQRNAFKNTVCDRVKDECLNVPTPTALYWKREILNLPNICFRNGTSGGDRRNVAYFFAFHFSGNFAFLKTDLLIARLEDDGKSDNIVFEIFFAQFHVSRKSVLERLSRHVLHNQEKFFETHFHWNRLLGFESKFCYDGEMCICEHFGHSMQ